MSASKKIVIHAVADCADCDFVEDDYNTAITKGRNHAIRTGHTVQMETSRSWAYFGRDSR